MKTAPGVVAEVIKNKMPGVKLRQEPILAKAGLTGVVYQIASSCSEYSLQDYSLLSNSIDSYRLLSILLIDNNR